MIQQLVVNGCSYTHSYALGNGHQDLAIRLGINQANSIAIRAYDPLKNVCSCSGVLHGSLYTRRDSGLSLIPVVNH